MLCDVAEKEAKEGYLLISGKILLVPFGNLEGIHDSLCPVNCILGGRNRDHEVVAAEKVLPQCR